MIFFNENNLVLNEGIIDVPATTMGIELGEAGCYRALHESTVEWFNLREKMMRLEHHAYVTEDTLLLEAGSGNFFQKIAAMFKKLLGMVKEMWNNFVKKFNAMTMKDKDFVKKYSQELRSKASSAKMKVNGFTYEGLEGKLTGLNTASASTLNRLVAEGGAVVKMSNSNTDSQKFEFSEESENQLKKSLSGADGEEFVSALKEKLRGGDEAEEIEVTISVAEYMMTTLTSAEKGLKGLESAKTTLEKCYSDSARIFDKLSSDIDSKVGSLKDGENATDIAVKGKGGATSQDDKGKFKSSDQSTNVRVGKSNDQVMKTNANAAADSIRKASAIVQTALGAGIEVYKERHAFSRATLGKLLTAKAVKNEGYELGYETGVLDRF